MIWGILEQEDTAGIDQDWVCRVLGPGESKPEDCQIHRTDDFVYCHGALRANGYNTAKPVESIDGKRTAVFSGRLYNTDELRGLSDGQERRGEAGNPASLLLALYERFGTTFADKVNGRFAFAVFDQERKRLILARDRLGLEPVYYYAAGGTFIFASSIPLILQHPGVEKELNRKAIGKVLIFNYNPGRETVFRNVHRLPAGHLMVVENGAQRMSRYWNLSFESRKNVKQQDIAHELLAHLRRAVELRVDESDGPGVFLSGGMDSSTVLALANKASNDTIRTFSFRCAGESFDESNYARMMAQCMGTEHHEIEYTAREILQMPEIVKGMNEPFCDVGINIATYLLGKRASQELSYVLTGDGGDELFGGHPVYEADKVGRAVDAIPSCFTRPILGLGSRLPDSDKKKDLLVKAKRFSESLSFPKEILSHRWRAYYDRNELGRILSPEMAAQLRDEDFFEDITRRREEAGDWDPLSLSLHNDYDTVVDFYFRRNDLTRAFGLETRYPMFDHHLVEYCATIPTKMKIKGWFDTKFILKTTMDGILPREIIHRKDKIGHSIPLKNWLREEKDVKEFVLDYLGSDSFKKRDFFRSSYVHRLVEQHLSKKRNNSHRLWTLAVLEMWLREHHDAQ